MPRNGPKKFELPQDALLEISNHARFISNLAIVEANVLERV